MMASNVFDTMQIIPAVSSVKKYLLNLQNRICHFIQQEEDVAQFTEDQWEHNHGGGGMTRVLLNGKVIEKAGVNFSHVSGHQLPSAATARRPELAASHFQ